MHLPAEKALEGKYVIQTEELDLSAVQAVEAYKELSEVERGFRELKDLIEMRPIYHHRPKRVRAHIFVAALAFLLACDVQRPGIGSLAHHGCSSAFPSMTNPAVSYSRFASSGCSLSQRRIEIRIPEARYFCPKRPMWHSLS